MEKFRTALRMEPGNLEAHLDLAHVARETGDRLEALKMLRAMLELIPRSRLTREERQAYTNEAVHQLAGLDSPARQPLSHPTAPPVHRDGSDARSSGVAAPRQPVRAAPKVGRNDPCPCGSGQKYKKCHGRWPGTTLVTA